MFCVSTDEGASAAQPLIRGHAYWVSHSTTIVREDQLYQDEDSKYENTQVDSVEFCFSFLHVCVDLCPQRFLTKGSIRRCRRLTRLNIHTHHVFCQNAHNME